MAAASVITTSKDLDRMIRTAEKGFEEAQKVEQLMGAKQVWAQLATQYEMIFNTEPKRRWGACLLGQAGIAFECAGRTNEAIHYLQRAIQIDPENDYFLSHLALCYEENCDFKNALATYDILVRMKPHDLWCQNGKARCCSKTGNSDKALLHYNRILSKDPNYYLALLGRGTLFKKMEFFEAALRDYTHAINTCTENMSALYKRGYCYEAVGKDTKALKDFEEAKRHARTDEERTSCDLAIARLYPSVSVSKVPSSFSSNQLLGVEIAKATISSPSQSTPTTTVTVSFSSSALSNGLVAATSSPLVNSTTPTTTTIAAAPSLATSEAAVTEEENAYKFFTTYLGMDCRSLIQEAIDYSIKGNYDIALLVFNSVLATNPDNASALLNRGRSFRDLGFLNAAIGDFLSAEQVPANLPSNREVFFALGFCYSSFGERQFAVSYFNLIKEHFPMDENLGICCRELAKLTESTHADSAVSSAQMLGLESAPTETSSPSATVFATVSTNTGALTTTSHAASSNTCTTTSAIVSSHSKL